MLNNNSCGPGEKYSWKHVYNIYFIYVSFEEEEKKTKFTTNAALIFWKFK